MSTTRRTLGLQVALALTAAAGLVGCTGGQPATEGTLPSSPVVTRSVTASPTPTVDPLDKARTLADHYDYDAALTALAPAGPAGATLRADITARKKAAVRWADNSQISHLFFHSLVVDPKRAFTNDATGIGFSQYMVTVSEFRKQLDQLYARGYVLIHPERIAAPGPDGVMAYQPILLPKGKKPLVLSLDDLSYYEYMTGHGFPDRLVVEGGKVRTVYTDAAGHTTTGAHDVVPIVDDFVAAHPDFSYRGDKGSVALTGYNGILGYRTSVREYKDTPHTRDEQAKAKVVADAMKAAGWNFASHSWGHINMTRSSPGAIAADAKRWDTEVRPLVGDTPELIFAFGADISGMTPYGPKNPKYAVLHGQEKFSYFFPIDASKPAWAQLTATSLRQARINVDGISLQHDLDRRSRVLEGFFDARSTMDPARPLPVPTEGGPIAGGG